MPLTRPLSESVVVITGASSGIGAATALQLARRGAHLVLAARGGQALDDVARKCERAGSQALPVPTDTADPRQVEQLAQAAEERFGRIDVWINNAAVAVYGGLIDTPMDELRRAIEVDLFGYLHGVRAAVPRLRAGGGGVLVMVGSILSELAFPYLGPYTIAKHGVLGMTDTLRQELRAEGHREVSVCTVLPSTIDTPLFAKAANYTGRALRPPPPISSTGRVAARIVELLESPRRESPVGIAARTALRQWRLAPALTERLLAWYGMRAQFQDQGEAAPSEGNVFTPGPEQDRVSGGWRTAPAVVLGLGLSTLHRLLSERLLSDQPMSERAMSDQLMSERAKGAD